MTGKTPRTLTERELEIMQVLWGRGEARLADVHDALNHEGAPVALTTVATQLRQLVQKGYLKQTGRHGRYVYTAACTKEGATRNLLDDFLGRLGLGRAPAFLIQLLRAETLSEDDRASLEAILREDSPPRPREEAP